MHQCTLESITCAWTSTVGTEYLRIYGRCPRAELKLQLSDSLQKKIFFLNCCAKVIWQGISSLSTRVHFVLKYVNKILYKNPLVFASIFIFFNIIFNHYLMISISRKRVSDNCGFIKIIYNYTKIINNIQSLVVLLSLNKHNFAIHLIGEHKVAKDISGKSHVKNFLHMQNFFRDCMFFGQNPKN